MRTRKQNKYLFIACGIILACVAIGYMFPGKVRSLFSTQQREESVTQDAYSKSALLSYAPSCGSGCADDCLSGTEVQALETYKDKLYMGTTNWGETAACIWPKTSAQINVLATEDGEWQRTPVLPLPAGCKQGSGGWEQINDLHTATFALNGRTATHLFTGALINEDGACPGVHASVFYLNDASTAWIDTGLTTELQNFYGPMNSEVRYIETYSDNTEACRADRPCVFAFVGPRDSAGGTKFPTVWRGVYAPNNKECDLICWDKDPEVHFNGIEAPIASRIVTSYAGKAGLYVGTGVPEQTGGNSKLCASEGSASSKCRPALLSRNSQGQWRSIWQPAGPIGTKFEDQVRGINAWEYADGTTSLWWTTLPVGTVYRIDNMSSDTNAEPIVEARLSELLPEICNGLIYSYQIYVHEPTTSKQDAQLLVGVQSCGETARTGVARIFHRSVMKDAPWDYIEMPEIVSDPNVDPKVNTSAVRWIETSPFDAKDIFFGTTDMGNGKASETARVFVLKNLF